jgi:autotransporter-associated beta strand protein
MRTKQLLLSLVLMVICLGASAQQLAFPGAQGWGRFATGGRTGSVYHVTNLNDSGSGSLRDAVSKPNRIVVFDVAGVINISSRIVFSNNLYVAGQTAPGEGITVYGDGVSFSGASNIIVRYMRFRMGHKGSSGKDCAGIANGANMIFDHCSFAWGLDETFSINPDGKGTTPQNITLQNSIVGQGLMTHSAGGLLQTDYVSVIGNFLCDNSTRNFKIKGINQYANNIVYNWSNGAYIMGGDSEGKSYVNIQSNLFINGPAVGGAAFTGGNADFHCYGDDNWQDRNRDGIFDPSIITDYNAATREATPYDYPALDLKPGKTLLETNLPTVGASLPYRDMTDCYMVDEVMSYGKSGALISNEETLVYGAPSTWQVYGGVKKTDSDNDGMPDAWETTNGTDPSKNDAMTIAANGYANIENYINSITVDDRDYFLRAPVALVLDKATTLTLSVSWRDYTYEETGFVVEIKKDGAYTEAGRTGANTTSFVINGLEPGTKYTVRVKAIAGNNSSAYTAETAMSTRPTEVGVIDIDTFSPDYTWYSGLFDKTKADGKNVLLAPVATSTLTLTDATSPASVVYKEPVSLTVSGAAIGGSASMNKGGTGTLTLTGSNTYTGATVLHDGVLEFSTLKNGGEPSAIGSSVEFAQNWIADGGTYRYTGANTTTNRSMKLSSTSTLDIKSATVTMNGVIEGSDANADLIIDGAGQITVGTTGLFGYKGATVLKGSTLYLSTADIAKAGIGQSSKLILSGGHLKTKGESSGYETYSFPIEVTEGTTSQFSPNRNCYINNKVSGAGTIQLNIPYLREYVQGDWGEFTGKLIANGVSTDSRGSMLLLDKTPKMDKTIIELKGNANLAYWSTSGNLTIGGISGTSGTYINGSSKQTDGFSCTWNVGSANSDETFAGKINNWSVSGSGHSGTTNIVKVGTGVWRLSGSNDYKGTTKVNAGTLVVNGANTGTGAVTVAAEATLAGKGSIAGAVTVNGTIQAGDTLINSSKLTLKSTLKVNATGIVSIPATTTKCNTLSVTGNITLASGATLMIADGIMKDAPANGTTYQVFDCKGTISGSFAEILPARPGEGQSWDTSELYTTGILKVIGGDDNPGGDNPGGDTPDNPQVETKTAVISWDNVTASSYDNSTYNNQVKGNDGTDAEGFKMVLTGNLAKAYSAASKIPVVVDDATMNLTTIKTSNGAMNTLYVPEGNVATKFTIWSYTNYSKDEAPRTSFWASVAGTEYTAETAQILQPKMDTANPSHVSFELNNVAEIAFKNGGEQQCIVLVVEYHEGDVATAIAEVQKSAVVTTEYFTMSGQRVNRPTAGPCIMRTTLANGKSVSRVVIIK